MPGLNCPVPLFSFIIAQLSPSPYYTRTFKCAPRASLFALLNSATLPPPPPLLHGPSSPSLSAQLNCPPYTSSTDMLPPPLSRRSVNHLPPPPSFSLLTIPTCPPFRCLRICSFAGYSWLNMVEPHIFRVGYIYFDYSKENIFL
jgi:hypothetical protein